MMRFLRPLLLFVLLLAAPSVWAKDGESRFVGLDDFLIHYKSWGKPTAPAVILIHGFTLDQSLWYRQIPALVKTHRVIALDSPGHGDSGRPRDIAYTMDLYARAVEAVAKDADISHAVLIGHSMGLPVIHTLVRRNVLKVDKAVFLDGAIMEPPADRKARAEQEDFVARMNQGLKGPDYTLVLEKFFEAFMPKVPPKDARTIIAKVRESDQTMVASTFEHFTDADVWAPLRSDVPVLGLYAKTSEAGVKPWLDAHYPKNKLVVWSDVDHFLQLEQPQRVNKAIIEFLK